ncbi:MAG: hypothetical protein HXS46_10115 [Theionarchaea archaeon]|nr:MAG: hypothetical protein AYK18_01325 [Theionarchaea archaeon DG-70]MBU7011034.1 hypothetical protein [Theionarchaea archaeon]
MKTEISSAYEKDIFWPEEETYLYLSWVDSKSISGLAISSFPLQLSRLVESNIFNLLDFFAPNLFIFSSEFLCHKFQSRIGKSSVIVLRKKGASVENGLPEGIGKEKTCPLKHLLLLSKTLNEKQLKSFQLATGYGFPVVDLIDFNKKAIKAKKEEITAKWDSMILDQKGSLEEDFVRTLKSALKSFENEYHHLLEKTYSIFPDNYSEYSLAPLFALLSYINIRKSRKMPNQPKIGIKSLRFEVIFEFEEDDISDFITALEDELSSDFFKIRVNEMKRIQQEDMKIPGKKHYRTRISITLKAILDSISLEDSSTVAKELSYLVVEKVLYNISTKSKILHETQIGAYERFKSRKMPEFWLKNADIAIEMSSFMVDVTKEIIRNAFGSHLDTSWPMKITRKSRDRFEIVFSLHFSSAYDYTIDGQDKGLFLDIQAKDPYTKIGIEHLMRKDFNKAFSFFRKAKIGLIRDYLETFGTSTLEKDRWIELINTFEEFLSLGDILPREILYSPTYTDESDPMKVFEMIRTNDKWIRTAEKLQEIDILERQIRLHILSDEEYAEIMSTLRTLLAETEFRFFKNFFNFIEDIGSFYVNILQKTEEMAPGSVKEWMKLSI